jgi:RNA polymerase sigma-70 factor (ECF subfamily)
MAPDHLYDRRWALALLGEAMGRLECEYAAAGKGEELRQIKPHLTAGRGEIPYAEIAATLGMTEGAARVAVHRLRKRFREVFRERVADTVSTPEEVEAELREVIEALGGGA